MRASSIDRAARGPADRVQLAWPFAVLGAAAGSQLAAGPYGGLVGGLTLALVLGFLGALISAAIERVRDWQVALMAPIVGAGTGAIMGFILDGLDAGALGLVAGTGFGLLALPPLVLIADVARQASCHGARTLLGRAQRRRLWLLTLTASALASLIVPALSNPWSHPAESHLAQLYAVATMIVAMCDSALWIAATTPRPPRPSPGARHPYREPGLPMTLPAHANTNDANVASDDRTVGALAAQALLYDALLVAVLAAALLVSA
jgi:hypothetical protein